MNILGGKYIPGALKLATKQLLFGYTLYPPSHREHSKTVLQQIETINFENSENTWYEIHYLNRGPTYVNLYPGQFSTSKPQGENLRFIKVSINKTSDYYRSKVSAYLRSVREKSRTSIETSVMIDSLEDAVTRGETMEAKSVDYFHSASGRLRKCNNHEEAEEIFHSLYKDCFFNYRMSVTSFSSCILLIQLQLEANLWMSENCFSNPIAFIKTYIQQALISNENLINNFIEIGNHYYSEASEYHSKFLNGFSIESHLDDLRNAAHRYWCALLVVKFIKSIVPQADLDYTALIAEEGWACCITGIHLDELVFNEPDYFPNLIAGQASRQNDFKPSFIKNYSSHVNPMFPRGIAEIFLGTGMIFSGIDDQQQNGFDLLIDLEQQAHQNPDLGIFEQFILNYALSKAYELRGEHNLTNDYLQRMSQSITTSYLLGE